MSRTAGEVANYLSAVLDGDPAARITAVANPEQARAEDLIYVDSARHAPRAAQSAAACVLCTAEASLPGKSRIMVENPKLAFAKVAVWLLPPPRVASGVHPTAVIAVTARLAPDASVGPYVVIEDGAEIGARAQMGAFCFVGAGSRLGEDCILFPRVTLYAGARLGNRVIVHSGTVIGSDGFGYVQGEGRQWKFPQIGGVEIADDVEIGANTTVDRGSLETTRIGAGVKIDNLVQIAHNVEIGEHSVIAAQTGISGSSVVGKGAVIGGQVGIADHCTVEDGAICGAQAGVPTGKTIRSGQVVWGTPARPLEKFKEQHGWLARLPGLAARLRRIEDKVGIGESDPG
ncbi:MAG: UDP-3-O-(3-hydroxymyristoyl)glucosamine N-acyltransferase [Candidatus Acidiferrales bacterium]